jgi:hypothetical protein
MTGSEETASCETLNSGVSHKKGSSSTALHARVVLKTQRMISLRKITQRMHARFSATNTCFYSVATRVRELCFID